MTADTRSPTGLPLTWDQISETPNDRAAQRAYEALCSNLRDAPPFAPAPESWELFFGSAEAEFQSQVWKFKVSAHDTSIHWGTIHNRFQPIQAFDVKADLLIAIHGEPPAPPQSAHRVFIRAPSGKPQLWRLFGPWSPDCAFLLQYA